MKIASVSDVKAKFSLLRFRAKLDDGRLLVPEE